METIPFEKIPPSDTIMIFFRKTAFSLTELLVVMALIGILVTLAVPAFVSIAQGSGMKKGINEIADALELARTEAMAKSTWVLVGLADTTADNPDHTPRHSLILAATRDGTTNFATTNLMFLSKTAHIKDIKILSSPTPWAGTNAVVLKDSTFSFTTPIAGKSTVFTNTVLAFSPQGEALINPASISPWIEIPIREVRGSTEIESKTASIRVSGLSGQVIVSY